MRPRYWILLLIALSFFVSGAFAWATTETPATEATIADVSDSDVYIIGLGESVRVEVPNGAKVHVSDGGIVRSRIIGRAVVMTGSRTGKTTLRFLNASGVGGENSRDRTVVVVERKVATTARLFQKQILARRGLKFNPSALPAIVVTGELLRFQDWEDLVSIARENKVGWRMEARVFPDVEAGLRKKIESELTRLSWPGQRFTMDDNGLTLTGGTESSGVTSEQKTSVTTLGIQLEISTGLTELEPMIRTQIVIAEVRRSRVRKLGIHWPQVATAALVPSLKVDTSELLLGLQAMEDEGEGRILAMPTLLCRSGGEAKFMAGGEVPIKLTSLRSSQVEWKKYGIQLHVQPKADRMKRMKFQLSTEISTLDDATAVDGVKGILVNRIETQFNLNGPQTIVLSGLIKREEGSSSSGLPFLKSIPVLGSLFSSEDYKKHLTELIIFVSPEVVIPDGKNPDEQR
jgi:pilus assembly protein CpaC